MVEYEMDERDGLGKVGVLSGGITKSGIDERERKISFSFLSGESEDRLCRYGIFGCLARQGLCLRMDEDLDLRDACRVAGCARHSEPGTR